MDTPPLIALLTDFGLADGYVGTMQGVMLGIAPALRFLDITHDIPPQDVAAGAWVLHTTCQYFPPGTIFLCVVDPGVGSARRAIALHAADRYFVGPDNGLFSYPLAEFSPVEAVALDRPEYYLPTRSATFHGRDVFAPCAAHLAAGIPMQTLGSPLDPSSLIRLALLQPTWEVDRLVGTILHIDHFGNLITNFGPALTEQILLSPTSTLSIGPITIAEKAITFAAGPVAAPFLLRDSSGNLAIALRNGSAAAVLGVARGEQVHISGLVAAKYVGIKSS